MIKAYLSAARDAKECATRHERFAMVSAEWSRSWRACLGLALWSLAACAWSSIEQGRKWRSSWITVEATAYCPCAKCTDGDGKTSTGRDANLAGVAVDPSVISHGSRLDIPGYTRGANRNGSWILADDVGNDITGNAIDVRMQSHKEAKKWGRKTIRVRVWTR